MSTAAQSILAHLETVFAERAKRMAVPSIAAKVTALKAYQQDRFALTYADLLHSRRYGPAARFFLQELYGPSDFARRDRQFARVVPALVRLFPPEIVATVESVARLHALSERLDTETVAYLDTDRIDKLSYLRAWQRHEGRTDRARQVALTADIARRLDSLTQRAVLRASLRMMRVPAQAAGLGDLQHFLETGFDVFRSMGGASQFISIIEERERAVADALFDADLESTNGASLSRATKMLPDGISDGP